MAIEFSKDSVRALQLADEVLEDLRIGRALIGALAVHVLLGVVHRATMDVDIAVLVSSWDQYERIRDALLSRGFKQGRPKHRLILGDSHIDLLPYSPSMLDGTKLVWPEGQVMDMTGFEYVFDSSESIELVPGLTWPVVSVPVFLILKLACFRDRGSFKDIADIAFCLEHFDEDPETSGRYEVRCDDPSIAWDDAGAYLLGKSVRGYSSSEVRELVEEFHGLFPDADAPAVDGVLRELGSQCVPDEERKMLVGLVKSFVKGFSS
jgi:predicted nucleotidyltransferase